MKLLLLSLILLTGCAFKHQAEEGQVHAPIILAWARGPTFERQVIEDGPMLILNVPIAIPRPAPEFLSFDSSDFPGEVAAQAGSLNVEGRSYPLSLIRDGASVEIRGIGAVFSADRFQSAALDLLASDKAGTILWRLHAQVRTLPALPVINALPASKFDAVKRLEDGQKSLIFLRAIEVKNAEPVPLYLNLKSRWLLGELNRATTTYVIDRSCNSIGAQIPGSLSYETNFVLLPFSDQLQNSWASEVANAQSPYLIPANGSVILVLYGQGGWLSSAAAKNDFSLPPRLVPIDFSCGSTHYHGTAKEGLEGGPVQLQFNEGSQAGAVSFTDESPGEPWSERPLAVFPTISQLF